MSLVSSLCTFANLCLRVSVFLTSQSVKQDVGDVLCVAPLQ